REAIAPAVMEIGEFLVIHAEEVKHRCVKIVDADTVCYRLVADFIGLAVTRASFNSGPGHPRHEPIWVMVATAIPLGDRHPAELSSSGSTKVNPIYWRGFKALNWPIGCRWKRAI